MRRTVILALGVVGCTGSPPQPDQSRYTLTNYLAAMGRLPEGQMLTKGIDLSSQARAEVLNAFGYRWTVENEQRAREWYRAGGQKPPSMRLVTDEEWLADHAFYVTKSGRLAWNRHRVVPSYMAESQ